MGRAWSWAKQKGPSVRISTIIAILCIAASGVLAPGRAGAFFTQPYTNSWDLCSDATSQAERTHKVPAFLLMAISMTESGRWNKRRAENIAWPWTVTSGKDGRFFDTKQDAIAHVRALKAKGVTNIDVGCMQINLRYHPDAFETLDEAFTPEANVAYAVQHLKALYKETTSWQEATAMYHSRNPRVNGRYRVKVLGQWNELRRVAYGESINKDAPKHTDLMAKLSPLDSIRTHKMNTKLRAKRAQERLGKNIKFRDRRMAKWGKDSLLESSFGANPDMQRMLKAKMRREKPDLGSSRVKAHGEWTKRRRSQLDAWRSRYGIDKNG